MDAHRNRDEPTRSEASEATRRLLVVACAASAGIHAALVSTHARESQSLGGLFALSSGLTLTSFMRRPEYGAPPPSADGQPAVVTRRRGPIGLAVTGLEHAARTVVHYPSYIWLAALCNRIDIYFWAYAAVNVLYLARCLLSVFLRLGRFQPAAQPVREDVLP